MSNFGTSTGTTQPFIPVVPRSQIGRYAGLHMHFASLADLNTAAAAERSNIGLGSALWADGQPFEVSGEVGKRAWNASAQHARNVSLSGGKSVQLASDSSACLPISGTPTGGADGDVAVDYIANKLWRRAAGAWTTTESAIDHIPAVSTRAALGTGAFDGQRKLVTDRENAPYRFSQSEVTWKSDVDPWDCVAYDDYDILQALPMASAHTVGMNIKLPYGKEISASSTYNVNTLKTGFDGNGSRVNFTAVNGHGFVLDADAGTVGTGEGWKRRVSVPFAFKNMRLIGNSAAGFAGIYMNGTDASGNGTGVRPVINGCHIEKFYAAIKTGTNAYIAAMTNLFLYSCTIGWWSGPGTNAGENMVIDKVTFDGCSLAVWLNCANAQLTLNGASLDYGQQLAVIDQNFCRLTINTGHAEYRGAQGAGGNNVYVINGNDSTETRGPVAGRKTWCDVDGIGSSVRWNGQSINLMSISGDATAQPPYSHLQLFKTRHVNSRIDLDMVDGDGWANVNNLVHTGPGVFTMRRTGLNTDWSRMPTRQSDQPQNNCIADPSFESNSVEMQDNIFIVDDTAEIVDRRLGANLSIVRTGAFHDGSGGTKSIIVTKVGAAASVAKFGALVMCDGPGTQYTAFARVMRDATTPMTGNLYCDLRWCKVNGNDSNGIPIIGRKGNPFAATTTFNTNVGSWFDVGLHPWNFGLSGPDNYPARPAWADHVLLSFNLDGGSAGAIYIDNLAIHAW